MSTYKIKEEDLNTLASIHGALNQLEVKGKNNLGILFNSMAAIEEILNRIKTENEPAPTDKASPKKRVIIEGVPPEDSSTE